MKPHVGYVGFSWETRMPGCACARGACVRMRARRRDRVKNLHILHILHFLSDLQGLRHVGFLLIIHKLHSRL